jgi:hypothetical protein
MQPFRLSKEISVPLFGTGEVKTLHDPVAPAPAAAPPPPPPPARAQTKPKDYGSIPLLGKQDKDTGTAEHDEERVILVEKAPDTFVKAAMVDPETLKPHQPGQNACLWLFHLLEGIAVTASLCLMVTQLVPVLLVKSSSSSSIGILSLALRVYITIFCLLFICTETQLPIPVVRQSQLLQTYASRGFLYSFIGLICVEEAYSERVKGIVSHVDDSFHIGWASVFMEVSSWLMLSTGALYAFLGLFCCKRLRDRMKQKEIEAWKRYKEDMAAWKQRFA